MKKIILLFCFLIAFSCKNNPKALTKITAKTIAVDSLLTSSKKITDIIMPYKKTMLAKIDEVLTYAPKDLTRSGGNMQSSLGNLLADLCYDIANPIFNKKTGKNIDFAMFNYGGIRAGITKGDVKSRNAFELMPFENTFVVTELSGKKVKELIAYFIRNKRAHPLSKQIQLTIKKNDYLLKIDGVVFDENKTYFVLTSDYLQGGGDRMNFFKNPKQLIKLDYKVRDAIITYFKSTKELTSALDNRVIIE